MPLERHMNRRRFITLPRRSILTIASVSLVAACASALHPRPQAVRIGIAEDAVMVKSGDEQMRVDIYRPKQSGSHPAAILLHGSNGIHSFAASTANRYAAALAEQGVITYVVHYFDGTGDWTASDSIETAHYFRWVKEVRDVISWAQVQKDVQPRRISIVGHSLGAWLAVGVGAMDTRVYRMVLFGSGLEPFLVDSIKRMPPTLLFHGEQDNVVPLSDVQHLQKFMQGHGFPVTLRIYPGQEHTFGDSVAVDALTRTAGFVAAPRRRPAAAAPSSTPARKDTTLKAPVRGPARIDTITTP